MDLPIGFSTRYHDLETGLLYYGYRYYESFSGKWISSDSIGEKGGINLYGFVLNSPLKWVDVLGRQPYGPGNLPFTGSDVPDPNQPLIGTYSNAVDLMEILTSIKKGLPRYPVLGFKYGQSIPLGVAGGATITGVWSFAGKINCCKTKNGTIGLMADGKFSMGMGVGVGASASQLGTLPKKAAFTPGAIATSDLPPCATTVDGFKATLTLSAQVGLGGAGIKASYKLGEYSAKEGFKATINDAPIIEILSVQGASIDLTGLGSIEGKLIIIE